MRESEKELLKNLLAKSKNIKSEPVVASVSTEYKEPSQEKHVVTEKSEELARQVLAEPFGSLYVNFSHTIPMAPYESVKISVGLSIPIGLEVPEWYAEEVSGKYKMATQKIEEMMEKELKSIDEFKKKRGL